MGTNVGKMIEAQREHEGYTELIKKLQLFRSQVSDAINNGGPDVPYLEERITSLISKEIKSTKIRRSNLEV